MYERKRHQLADGDFLDLDFCLHPQNKKILVLVHGFEGSSNSKYIKFTAKYFYDLGFNILSINLRGCSGEDNNQAYAYHSGKTEDLNSVMQDLRQRYSQIYLMGFSLGANLVLKYLADYQEHPIVRAVAVSAPFDLELSAQKIVKSKLINNHFLRSLKPKIKHKKNKFPDILNHIEISKLLNIIDIDEHYTAPLHGFTSAAAYYKYASCRHYLNQIKTPTLIINALDDPLLDHPDPIDLMLHDHPNVHLVLTKHGGHVGFLQPDLSIYYHKLSEEFFNS